MDHPIQQFDAPPDGRKQIRTHLFVAATLYTADGSTPVRIRNMSQFGALIESTDLPGVGNHIKLKRGRLSVAGRIAWREARKAGVQLEAAIHVSDWMFRAGSAGQQQVDALVSIARAEEIAMPGMACEVSGQSSLDTELRLLRQDLSAMEEELLKDVILVATHPEIQAIDMSIQRIDRILRSLRSRG